MRKLKGWFVYSRRDSAGWILRYLDESTRTWRDHRVPKEFTAKRQAEAYAAAWLAELKRLGERPEVPVVPKADKGPTIRDLRDKWIEMRKGDPKLAASTRAGDKANMDHHIIPALGKLVFADMTTARLRQFVRDLTAKRSASTVRNVVGTLSTFVQDCRAEEWITLPGNPVRDPAVTKLLPTKELKEPLPIPKVAVERLITSEKVPVQRRIRYAHGALTGMRIGEMAAVLWQDFEGLDGDKATMDVTKSIREGVASDTKTHAKGHRKLPVHSQLARRLRWWHAEGWEQFMGRRPEPCDPVFPDLASVKQPHAARFIQDDLRAVGCADSVGGEKLKFHGLRKSFRTWLENAGVSESIADAMIGHVGTSVARKHYIGRDVEVWREAIETIRLDLAHGEVLPMRLRAVVGGDTMAMDTGQGNPDHVAGGDVKGRDVGSFPVKNGAGHGTRTSEVSSLFGAPASTGGASIGNRSVGSTATGARGDGHGSPCADCDVPSGAVMVPRDVLLRVLALLDEGDVEAARTLLAGLL